MKKIITIMFVFILFAMPIKAYADSASVEVIINGEVKKGSTIDILVNLKDVDKFYAASVDFTYDTNQLKVQSINASEFITKHVNDIMELGGETDKNGNTASYSFTFLGEKDGIKGSGTLAVITAQVLNDEKLSIGQDTMKVKLVQRVGDTVENYAYKFSGYNISSNTEGPTNTQDKPNSDNAASNNSSDSQTNNSNEQKSDSNEQISDNNNSENLEEKISQDENITEDNKVADSEDISNNDEQGIQSDKTENDNIGNKEENLLASKINSNWIYWASGIVVILIAGGAGYYLYRNKSKKDDN